MYFPRDGPWAEPDFRGGQFFPRIRPTFRQQRIRAAQKSAGQG